MKARRQGNDVEANDIDHCSWILDLCYNNVLDCSVGYWILLLNEL